MAYPTLNANIINSALYNQIISQQIFTRIRRGSELVDKARVEGTLYGDTKTYFAADAIHTKPFVQDSVDALNLLAIDRNKSVKTQDIVLNVFRIAETTTDNLLSKQAWSDEGTFAKYTDLLNQMVPTAMYLHDTTEYNAFIGACAVGTYGKQNPSALSLTSGKEGQEIAQALADICSDMSMRPSRDYNDYQHITKFSLEEIKIVWNSKWVNFIEKINLPVLFHKDGVMEKFAENVIHEDYFGDKVALSSISAATVDATHPVKKTGSVYTWEPDAANSVFARVTEEVELLCTDGVTKVSFFAGELLQNPAGKTLVVTDLDGKLYVKNDKIICKVFVQLPAYMSACELSTEFVNVKNHSTNRYLVFGRNTLEKFDAYPVVTVKKS